MTPTTCEHRHLERIPTPPLFPGEAPPVFRCADCDLRGEIVEQETK